MPHFWRTSIVVLIGLGILLFAAQKLVDSPSFLQPRDFLEYWSAGSINANGGNPYDPVELLQSQQSADPGRTGALMMWNPPWSLSLYMPLGLLPPRWATLIWVALQLLTMIVAGDLLWRTYGGSPRLRWLPFAIGIIFAPVYWMVLYGQNTGILLLGLAGFIRFRQTNRPWLAGLFAALTALKPHLLAVFGVLIVLDALTPNGRKVLAAGAIALIVALIVAMLPNPEVVTQYRQAVRDPGPEAVALAEWKLPTPGYWLRVGLGGDYAIQFIPCVVACFAAVGYRIARGSQWEWVEEFPRIIWLSVLSSPYGGWIFDLVILLVPAIPIAVAVSDRRAWGLGVALMIALISITVVSLAFNLAFHEFFWIAPSYFLLDLAARWWLGRRNSERRRVTTIV